MDAVIRDFVRQRAGKRCEYCHIPDQALDLPFHVEHIIASIHGTDDGLENLAWACPRCNLRKGPNLTTIDSETDTLVQLFNPRTMAWTDHFLIQLATVIGITPIGRGTIRLLDMNQESRVHLRRELIEQNEFDFEP